MNSNKTSPVSPRRTVNPLKNTARPAVATLTWTACSTRQRRSSLDPIDVAPYAADDQAAEVERLIALGARKIDIGQGDVPWEVMADPEGNEFCVLTPRD